VRGKSYIGRLAPRGRAQDTRMLDRAGIRRQRIKIQYDRLRPEDGSRSLCEDGNPGRDDSAGDRLCDGSTPGRRYQRDNHTPDCSGVLIKDHRQEACATHSLKGANAMAKAMILEVGATARSFQTVNPATGDSGEVYQAHTVEQALAIAADAHQAQISWRRADFKDRSSLMR